MCDYEAFKDYLTLFFAFEWSFALALLGGCPMGIDLLPWLL